MKSFLNLLNCCSKDKKEGEIAQAHSTIILNEEISSNVIESTSKSSGKIRNNKFNMKQPKRSLTENIVCNDNMKIVDMCNKSSYSTISLFTKLEDGRQKNLTEPNLIRSQYNNERNILRLDYVPEGNSSELSSKLKLEPYVPFKNKFNIRKDVNSRNDHKVSHYDSAKGSPLYTNQLNESIISSHSMKFSLGNVIVLDSEIVNGKKILLEDEVGNLLHGEKLQIDAAGLKGSLRNKRDGITYIGTIKETIKGEIISDFILNTNGMNSIYKGTSEISFMFSYDRVNGKYFIRNLNKNISKDNSLIFVKLEQAYTIRTKKYFMIGHILISVEIESDNSKQINITVLDKNNHMSKHYTFLIEDSPITIGRLNSTIIVDHNFISKAHCTLEYNKEDGQWILYDGDKSKKSSPGIWLMLDSKYEIDKSTSIRIGKCIIKVNLII